MYEYLCMCVSLAPGKLIDFIHNSVYESLSIIGGFLVNMNIPTWKKYWPFIGATNHKIAIFSKMGETILVKFHKFMETVSLNTTSKVVSSGK
jgi:hypothetical protein